MKLHLQLLGLFLLISMLSCYKLYSKVTKDALIHTLEEDLSSLQLKNNLMNYEYADNDDPSFFSLNPKKIKKYEEFKFSLDLGYAYRIAKSAPNLDALGEKIIDGIRPGLETKVNAMYFYSRTWGVGLKASMFNTFNTFDQRLYDERRIYQVDIENNSRTVFIGPQMICRFFPSRYNNNTIWIGLSMGYMGYFHSVYVEKNMLMKEYGSTLGSVLEFGYDLKIAENWSVGLAVNYTGGTIFQMTLEDGVSGTITTIKDLKQGEGLARVGMNFGIRFGF